MTDVRTTRTASPRVTGPRSAPGSIETDPTAPGVLRLRGEVDGETLGRFCARLSGRADLGAAAGAIAASGVRELDLADVTFADSALVNLTCAVHRGTAPGRVRVRGATGAVRRLFALTGTDPFVDLRS